MLHFCTFSGSLEMLASMREKAEVSKTSTCLLIDIFLNLCAALDTQSSERECVFLHLGVNAKSKEFNLEQFGYNVANFSIPDERGWVAQQEVIVTEEVESIQTKLPLEDIFPGMLEVNSKAQLSTDPGRYICNYVYFHSLHWAKQQLNTTKLNVS